MKYIFAVDANCIKESDDIALMQDLLKQFPNGKILTWADPDKDPNPMFAIWKAQYAEIVANNPAPPDQPSSTGTQTL